MTRDCSGFSQDEFDCCIGRLDRILSELINYSQTPLDIPNIQTLKHHAEDMIGAGNKILERINSQ